MQHNGKQIRGLRWQTCMVFLGVCALALAAFAQQPTQKEAPAPTLRVTTHLVEVSVIVQDKNGNPVTGLTKDDFTLLEQGRPQIISTFAMESSRALPRAASTLPPNTFTNRLEQRVEAPTSISVILLDGLNTAIQDQTFARGNILKFLEQVQPQDRVAIYLLGHGEIRVLHDFSSDSASLIAALRRYRGRLGHEEGASNPEEPNTGMDELDEFLREANQRVANFYLADRAINTSRALEAVARHLERFPGRKNLIWVSASFPISYGLDAQPSRYNLSPDRRTFFSETEKAARALSNANVAVYPVDARGLIGAFPPNANPARGGGPSGRGMPPPIMTTMNTLGSNIDTMQLLADKTGGKAYYNRNDIDRAVRSAIEDSRVSYVLGYYPTHGKWDGRFVPLNVKVNRPGVRVRFRKGYYAGTETKLEERELRAALSDAARSPLESNGVGITARVEDVPNSSPRALKISLDIDPRDINLIMEEGRWTGAVDILFSQRNREGLVVSGVMKGLGMRLKPETHDQLVGSGITFTDTVQLDPNAYLLRVVVRDQRSGSVGTVSIPLTPAQKVGS